MTIDEIITAALNEDIGEGDHTSLATVPVNALGKVRLLVKEETVLAGVAIAEKVFKAVDDRIRVSVLMGDGIYAKPGDTAFYAEGPSIALLIAERTVLNFMQRMSGIATLTRKYVDAVAGTKAKILDTRKTTPNFRLVEKEAVRIGGGENHRFGLFDMILIKDNHVDFAGGITLAIIATKRYLELNKKDLRIEIEARSIQEVREILSVGGVHRIMLDNFSFDDLRSAVGLINGQYETEASGGIKLSNVRQYAECGVDFISVGALTHQINSIDLSLKAVIKG